MIRTRSAASLTVGGDAKNASAWQRSENATGAGKSTHANAIRFFSAAIAFMQTPEWRPFRSEAMKTLDEREQEYVQANSPRLTNVRERAAVHLAYRAGFRDALRVASMAAITDLDRHEQKSEGDCCCCLTVESLVETLLELSEQCCASIRGACE